MSHSLGAETARPWSCPVLLLLLVSVISQTLFQENQAEAGCDVSFISSRPRTVARKEDSKLLNWGRSDSVLAFLPPLRFSWIYKSAGKFSAWDSLVAQTIKNLPAMQEIWVPFPGWEDPLEKEMATHSRILPWRIPWTEEPGGLQSMVLQRVRHDWETNNFTFTFSEAAYWVSLFSPMNWFF